MTRDYLFQQLVMKKIFSRVAQGLAFAMLALIIFAAGTVNGSGRSAEDLRKLWFDFFGLLGTWASGLGAFAAAYAALHIAEQQSEQNVRLHNANVRLDKVASLHHMMAIVNDLRGRVTYMERMHAEGGRPLAALTNCAAGLVRRYEVLYDRELYAAIPGNVVDQITNLSGSIGGIETAVSILATSLENKLDRKIPAGQFPPGRENPFVSLANELDSLFDALEAERAKIEPA